MMANMTSVPNMPGRWPTESRGGQNELLYPRIDTQVGELSLQVPNSHSAASSRSSNDELFFECPAPTPSPGAKRNGESSMPSYLVFEPVVESVAREEPANWKRYEPPQELLHLQEDTSEEIRQIIEPSVERIKARYAEEEQRRITEARRERPLARTGRASVKPPKREPLMTGALHPLDMPIEEHGSNSRLSAGSATSLLSNDSGYSSQSPSPSSAGYQSPSPSTPSKGKGRSFGFHSIFGRRDKSIVTFEGLKIEQNSGSSSSASGSGEISIPVPSAPVPAPVTTTTTECVSCLDDFEASEMIPLSCHSYCTDCFTRLITTAIDSETHWPAKCCLNPIPSTNILPHINSTLKEKYHLREAEWSIPAGDRIYCAQASCGTWIPPKNINTSNHVAKCPKCSHKCCTTCRGPSHGSVECPQDPALLATINLAELEGWRRCYQCQALVEHNQGCRHMTCRCKAQFCYICGLRWRTCACTDAQLGEIRTRAENHRNQVAAETARQARERLAREAAEEEERIVLQLVADFVAAEAERERVAAEERRVREEAERAAREEERRRAEEQRLAMVSAKFRLLGSEMEALHNIQRVLLSERYEFETARLQRSLQDELDVLSVRHPPEIAAQTASSQAAIAAAEQAFMQEYQSRLAEEQRIEENYVIDLRAFWNGKPDAEFKVRDARDELRRDQDKEYKFWDNYRRTQLHAIREGEERKIESLRVKHRAEVKAAEGRARIDEVEWKKGSVAEGRWFEAVIAERVDMLRAEETNQYAEEGIEV